MYACIGSVRKAVNASEREQERINEVTGDKWALL